MGQRTSPLDNVSVAAPCDAGWDNMVGNERMRFCGQCTLNVYNLSGMTKREAERIVLQAEGRLCVRYYRRADGTILTKNCPIGLQALKRRVSRIATVCASAVISFFGGILAVTALRERPRTPTIIQGAMIQIEKLPKYTVTTGTYDAPGYTMGKPMMGGIGSDEGSWVDGQAVITDRPVRRRARE